MSKNASKELKWWPATLNDVTAPNEILTDLSWRNGEWYGTDGEPWTDFSKPSLKDRLLNRRDNLKDWWHRLNVKVRG